MPQYVSPPRKTLNARRAACEAAYADLSPQARADIDAMLFRLQGIRNIGQAAALEIVCAAVMVEEWPR